MSGCSDHTSTHLVAHLRPNIAHFSNMFSMVTIVFLGTTALSVA